MDESILHRAAVAAAWVAVLQLTLVGHTDARSCKPCWLTMTGPCPIVQGCEVVLRPCGCCPECALPQFARCGAYTARCASGLWCYDLKLRKGYPIVPPDGFDFKNAFCVKLPATTTSTNSPVPVDQPDHPKLQNDQGDTNEIANDSVVIQIGNHTHNGTLDEITGMPNGTIMTSLPLKTTLVTKTSATKVTPQSKVNKQASPTVATKSFKVPSSNKKTTTIKPPTSVTTPWKATTSKVKETTAMKRKSGSRGWSVLVRLLSAPKRITSSTTVPVKAITPTFRGNHLSSSTSNSSSTRHTVPSRSSLTSTVSSTGVDETKTTNTPQFTAKGSPMQARFTSTKKPTKISEKVSATANGTSALIRSTTAPPSDTSRQQGSKDQMTSEKQSATRDNPLLSLNTMDTKYVLLPMSMFKEQDKKSMFEVMFGKTLDEFLGIDIMVPQERSDLAETG